MVGDVCVFCGAGFVFRLLIASLVMVLVVLVTSYAFGVYVVLVFALCCLDFG